MTTDLRTTVEYLPDRAVDAAADEQLRALLSLCFTKAEDAVFKERRYFRELCPHRWVVRAGGVIRAHLGAHEKLVRAAGKEYRVGGIAEVCVHPELRGRGVARKMLESAHAFLAGEGFQFALLFGEPGVYASSGYAEAKELCCGGGAGGWTRFAGPGTALVRPLAGTAWPGGMVRLPGPVF